MTSSEITFVMAGENRKEFKREFTILLGLPLLIIVWQKSCELCQMNCILSVNVSICPSGFVRATLCTTLWVQDYVVHHQPAFSQFCFFLVVF